MHSLSCYKAKISSESNGGLYLSSSCTGYFGSGFRDILVDSYASDVLFLAKLLAARRPASVLLFYALGSILISGLRLLTFGIVSLLMDGCSGRSGGTFKLVVDTDVTFFLPLSKSNLSRFESGLPGAFFTSSPVYCMVNWLFNSSALTVINYFIY